ncbi:hypothetical protein CBR_g55235 [Chara braunii]|uniref:Uncharacterized protein n=1 Tax=Chara braunii TaxID=69332 RepID=A0A388MCR3_CHABU|nr:hypothetical protein CBR_g55235 [Chara braunii]|eukprot:GBG92354.1 hypothetical protein CBR_g55235 [Chara braunii]
MEQIITTTGATSIRLGPSPHISTVYSHRHHPCSVRSRETVLPGTIRWRGAASTVPVSVPLPTSQYRQCVSGVVCGHRRHGSVLVSRQCKQSSQSRATNRGPEERTSSSSFCPPLRAVPPPPPPPCPPRNQQRLLPTTRRKNFRRLSSPLYSHHSGWSDPIASYGGRLVLNNCRGGRTEGVQISSSAGRSLQPCLSGSFLGRCICLRQGAPAPSHHQHSERRKWLPIPPTRLVLPRSVYISAPASPDVENMEGRPKEGEISSSILPPEPSKPVITFPFILSLMMKNKLRLFLACLSLIAGTTSVLMMPRYSGRFFEVIAGITPGSIKDLLLRLAVYYTVEAVSTVIFISSMCGMWENVIAEVRVAVFERIITQKIQFFDTHKVGELTALMSNDVNAVRDLVFDNVSRDRGLRSISEVLGTLSMLWLLSPQIAPILGLLIVCFSAGFSLFRRTSIPFFIHHSKSQVHISEVANETFAAIRTVRLFGGETKQMDKLQVQLGASLKNGIKLGFLKGCNESFTRIAVYLSLIAVYTIGGMQVEKGTLPVRAMVAFIGYTFTLTFAMQGLVNTLGDLRKTITSVERINTVLANAEPDSALMASLKRNREKNADISGSPECEPTFLLPEQILDSDKEKEEGREGGEAGDHSVGDHHDGGIPIDVNGLGRMEQATELVRAEDGQSSPITAAGVVGTRSVCNLAWNGSIAIEGVTFAYPARSDVTVLDAVKFTMPRGKVTALVGPSGSGKSTIVQLISRFYEPTDGKITLSGLDIRDFDKREWASAIAVVSQEPVLFAMSVAENIAYGLPALARPSQEAIIEAAKAANAHDFVVALPHGYNTMVGERGGLLSGGQRQRIAIARALLKNSPILVLDEATSALDSVSEQLVQQALNHLMKGRTSLVIAHRLSTTQSADQIIVLDKGRVLEIGTHQELVERGALYANLVSNQRLVFE